MYFSSPTLHMHAIKESDILKILIDKIIHGIMCSPSVAENYEVAAA
jgi:hypothetical protein